MLFVILPFIIPLFSTRKIVNYFITQYIIVLTAYFFCWIIYGEAIISLTGTVNSYIRIPFLTIECVAAAILTIYNRVRLKDGGRNIRLRDRHKASVFALSGLALLFAGVYLYAGQADKMIRINEVSGDAAAGDYVELYNASATSVSLNGWYLMRENGSRSYLPNVFLEPDSYIVLGTAADGAVNSNPLDFNIPKAGCSIELISDRGNCIDAVEIPVLKALVEPPVLSKASGFYSEEFELTISAQEGQTVYYTLDGSLPTENSLVYQEPILIQNASDRENRILAVRNVILDWADYFPEYDKVDKGTVLRACAVDKDFNSSEIVTATYFVGLDEWYWNRPVMSLVFDFEDLFGEDGICVTGREYDEQYLSAGEASMWLANFMGRGMEFEKPVYFEYFDNAELLTAQNAGIKLQGASSRRARMKRFSLSARKEYGDKRVFDHIFFSDKTSHSISMRPNSEDWLIGKLVEDRDVGTRDAISGVSLFLNGEYYNTAFWYEKYDKEFFCQTYGILDRDNIIMVENGNYHTGENDGEYDELLNYMEEGDFADPDYYDGVKEIIDVQSYIDYMCTNIYVCNMDMYDWKNYMLWRTKKDERTLYGDTRWRWLLYDLDAVTWCSKEFYNVNTRAEINSFSAQQNFAGIFDEMLIFRKLRNNPEFCRQFVLSFMDMANVNFAPERVEEIMAQMGFDLSWNDSFFLNRFDYAARYLAEEFDLTGTLEKLELNVVTDGIADGAGGGNQAQYDDAGYRERFLERTILYGLSGYGYSDCERRLPFCRMEGRFFFRGKYRGNRDSDRRHGVDCGV